MNKTVLITGGSRGIGKGLVESFAKNDYQVAFVYSKNKDLADQLCNNLSDYQVKAYQADLSNPEDIKRLITELDADFSSVDILINNAGITKDKLFMRMKDNDITDVINLNLVAAMNLSKIILKKMIRKKNGVIINMSSVVSLSGNAGQCNYAASKAGLNAFTKSLAKEVAPFNIRVNAIAPGFIETDMTNILSQDQKEKILTSIPMKKFGSVKDIANLAIFLSSDQANYLTGQIISINGGMF